MIINGEKLDLKELKFVDYVEKMGLRANLIALELNGKIVPKSEFESLILKKGDRAEVVSFVGGG